MKNKKTNKGKIILICLAICISFALMLIPLEEVKVKEEQKSISINELHFNHLPITYNFEIVQTENGYYKCPNTQKERVRKAFEMIKNETDDYLSFKEVEKGDIQIFCYGRKISNSDYFGYTIIEGEGGYEAIGNEITSGILNFYDTLNPQNQRGNCLDLEIHEILHILGFGHIEDENSIMYYLSTYPCKYKIDEEIIEDLKRIYPCHIFKCRAD